MRQQNNTAEKVFERKRGVKRGKGDLFSKSLLSPLFVVFPFYFLQIFAGFYLIDLINDPDVFGDGEEIFLSCGDLFCGSGVAEEEFHCGSCT